MYAPCKGAWECSTEAERDLPCGRGLWAEREWERVKNERKCRDAEAEMKNARKRKAEMLPTAIRMLNSSHNNNNNSNNKSSTTATATRR